MNEQILVVGGGPVGMALALALKQGGLDPLLVDAREEGAAGRDPRVLALAPGTRQTLERLGVWTALSPTAIETIHISQKGGFGRTVLAAKDHGLPALGYVEEAGALAWALDWACREAGVRRRHHVRVTEAAFQEDCVRVSLESGNSGNSGETLDTSLIAWAEGRMGEGADIRVRDYQQHGVITVAKARQGRGRIAFERFTEDGPLALLPLKDGYAVVFTASPDKAAELMALSDGAFLARLQAQFGERLEFVSVEPRFAYPLILRYRDKPVAPRQAWLGNSAQAIHPVGGQGFNLALRDAWQLADTLLKCGGDPGAESLLARYAQRRSLDRRATIGFTDFLVRGFSNANPLLALGRGLGLFLLDVLPPARDFVARRMMYGARAWP